MSIPKLAPLAAVALLLSASAHADPAKTVKPTAGIIMNGWPIDLHSVHSGRASLIIVDWPDEVRGAHPNINVLNGRPQGIKNTPRKATAPKGH